MKKLFFILSIFLTGILFSQNQTFTVHPNVINANYNISDDDNTITINTVSQNNKLFLFLGGTNSNTSNYNALVNLAADIGYDVINLSYLNGTAAASLSGNSDSLIFNKFRQELCFGTPVCDDVTIDSLNSIYQRTVNLINYLDVNYPSHNWGQYLSSPTTLNWNKIALGGHSQGSGHAAYLAKQFPVDRVLMFSGPNDYHNIHLRSANWLRTPGITPYYKHYSYLSLNDEIVDYAKQYEDTKGLGLFQGDDSTHVDNISSPYNYSRCLYTSQPPGFVIINHNVPTKNTTINQDVWTYMLTDESPLTISEQTANNFSIFPNPTNDFLQLKINEHLFNKKYSIINLQGQVLISGNSASQNLISIPVNSLSPGSYIITVENQKASFIVR